MKIDVEVLRRVPRGAWAAGVVLCLGAGVAAVVLSYPTGRPAAAVAPPGATSTTITAAPVAGAEQAVAVPAVAPSQLATLPEATTMTKLAAPVDTSTEATDGAVAHPTTELAVYAAPGNTAFARLPVKQLGNPTWLPVVGRQSGWVQVLLPSRPNGAVGWIDAAHVQLAKTPYLIRVNLTTRELTVFRDTTNLGSWKAAIGAPGTPTPTGRTFLLAQITDPAQSYSPVIIPLGTHSPTLDTYGGGPGTVAIHAWPDKAVYGAAVSHGCVRIPTDALRQVEQIPLGTLVIVTP